MNPLQISKPVLQWTVQECIDSLRSLVVVSLPRSAASEVILRYLRWSATFVVTVAGICKQQYLRKWHTFREEEWRFMKVAKAYEQLTEGEDSAEYWVQKSASPGRWHQLWQHLRQINTALLVLSFILIFRTRLVSKQIMASRADSKQEIVDKTKAEESKSKKPDLPSFTEVMRASHWTTHIICLFMAILFIGQLWILWQLAHIESNPFGVLGICPTTDPKIIKRAYRHLTLRYHSD